MPETFLRDCVVVESGDRIAVGACGSLLAGLGATVVLAEDPARRQFTGTKWNYRPLFAAGKWSIQVADGSDADRELFARLVARADVVLDSSDLRPRHHVLPSAAIDTALVCDISAFGTSGPLAHRPYSDALIQAASGVLDSTGSPDHEPTLSQSPLVEFTAAIYAAAAVLAGMRARRLQGISQTMEVALYDVAISMLASFLPTHFVGGQPGRIGNHHPSMSPWNLYRTRDGWVLICAGSNDEWHRICEIFRHPELARDARFESPTMRVRNRSDIDKIVERWTEALTVADCVERFHRAAVSCGPVYSIAELFKDPGLEQRKMFPEIFDSGAGERIRVPGSLFRGSICHDRPPSHIPKPGDDREFVASLPPRAPAGPGGSITTAPQAPLSGVRVLEMGNYTTAPLAGRQLGALGAYVVKIEPPRGDLGRPLPPVRDGQGYFFTLGNSDKRTLAVDLRTAEGKALFRRLLGETDILVENMKVGALARLGFSEVEIARTNPKLVHCSITGFGSDSPYADRVAMDTSIQGMSGIMDLTRSDDGVPYKTGISIADIAGGQLALVAALAALAYRERTGRGQRIEISMQAGGAWLTQTAWNPVHANAPRLRLIRCTDGYVAVESGTTPAEESQINSELSSANSGTRLETVAKLAGHGIACAPVLSISEAAEHAQTKARNLILSGKSAANVQWPLLACPMRFARTPVTVRRAIGPAGADAGEVMVDWNLAGDTGYPAGEKRSA